MTRTRLAPVSELLVMRGIAFLLVEGDVATSALHPGMSIRATPCLTKAAKLSALPSVLPLQLPNRERVVVYLVPDPNFESYHCQRRHVELRGTLTIQ
ncbi:hypothetical protein F441_22149 [Phytophthora nicotianae CJ01A1]|uniref:Uncharacterized protein n=6 Tax=Phytophthora nicotianae TaxID=4792 RepID=W2PG57_PHYN3|nr:hypothetical protein PPTG_24468 [Phytophthora nicotianae INRA-310]ETI30651.1 hypothetical protein F443_22247 [Phytophthora nicotianae P1569]ETL77719.1 hypothetical protein L917_21358 [Phytophthora nicotianae]ETO59403.1 hypothetical protein F444_22241 [Phytophthora nicotianae P1976]ETP00445.1 hypothetical protein F441_22149 [Phytophthora nicotianae CJ01A1]ETP28600.1 hypothetical protein F442_22118 [Phytophthora nicotianae P10297]